MLTANSLTKPAVAWSQPGPCAAAWEGAVRSLKDTGVKFLGCWLAPMVPNDELWVTLISD